MDDFNNLKKTTAFRTKLHPDKILESEILNFKIKALKTQLSCRTLHC